MLSGTWNNLRSMITGWYAIRKGAGRHELTGADFSAGHWRRRHPDARRLL